MATYDLLKNNDPRLKIKLESVDDNVSDRLTLQNNLLETMDKYNGLGLAANQCGIMQRAFAAYIDWPDRVKTVCFNPEIVWSSEETSFEEEGCLTYPGLYLKIRRPVAIKVTYENVEGNVSTQNLKDLEARIFQHEYDHMNGYDFTTKVSPLVLQRAKKKLKNNIKKNLRKYGNI
tara:strand:- start:7006 stop:7530 length:525 start_codon:yes stop_codon:yes gene_type:complete